jgi:CspA family cold shock protein
MVTGTIKRLVADRGFGFVAQEGKEGDLFFHASSVRGATFETLRVGQRVQFDAEPDPRGTGVRAINLRPAVEDEAEADTDSDDTVSAPPQGTFTVRFENEQRVQEGLEGLGGGSWTLQRLTRLPDGSATAEFTAGPTPGGER